MVMCTRSLIRQLLCVTVATFVVIWVPLYFWRGTAFLLAPAIGGAISFLVILSAYYLNRWAFRKSHKVFLRALVGGMVARIVLAVGLFFGAWWFLKLPPALFLISLIVYYLIFQVLEARFIQTQMGAKTAPKKE